MRTSADGSESSRRKQLEEIRDLALDNLAQLLKEASIDSDVLMKLGGANLIRALTTAEDSLAALEEEKDDSQARSLQDAKRLHRELQRKHS